VRTTVEALRSQPGIAVEIATLADAATESDLHVCAGTPVHVTRALPPARLGLSPGLMAVLMRTRPDIVHVHGVWQLHTAAVLLWSRLTGRPYVVAPHGMLDAWIRARSPRLKAIVGRLFHDNFLQRAAAFQALTVKEVDDILAVAPKANCRVVPNGVHLVSDDAKLPAWWRPEFAGLDIYLYFGRIHEKKGCVELARAWDTACRRDATFKARSVLVYCGWRDGIAEFDVTIDLIARHHGNVILGGAQFDEDRHNTLAAASFIVLPSKSEGLPLVVLEAWAKGIPVLMTAACNLPVGFATGAAREIHCDVDQLANELLAAGALDLATRTMMAASARELAKGAFSLDRIAADLLKLYACAIDAASAARRGSSGSQ
jgi:glycosyltransferase involved in cell wall biosynthesis